MSISVEQILRDPQTIIKFGRVDDVDSLERAVQICNERFQTALASGDEAAMDHWQALTRYFESQHALQCGIAACGVMLQYGVSDAVGHPLKRSLAEASGLSGTTDAVLGQLQDSGIEW